MTAALLVAALALVAAATQPYAFDLLALKRSLLFLSALPLLASRPLQQLLGRPLHGPLKALVGALGVLLLAGFAGNLNPTFASASAPSAPVLAWRSTFEFLLFVLLALLTREVAWEQAGRLLAGITWIGAALALVALLQVAGFDPIYGAQSLRVAVATFGNSNAFAAFAAPALAVAIGLASRERALAARVGVVLLAAALVVARGRGGWLAATIGALAALLVAARTGRSWRPAAGMLLIGGALGFALTLGPRGGDEQASKPLGLGLERRSNVVRLEVAKATLEVIADAPWIGHGPGSFRHEFPLHRRAAEAAIATRDGAASEVDHPHVEWLRLAAEGGWLTAGLVAVALLGTLLAAARGPKVARADDGAMRAAAAGGVVAWLIASLTWSTLYDPATALLGALLLGIASAGEEEVTLVAPRNAWLARLFSVGLALLLAWSGAPTLAAEWREFSAARTGRIDASELAAIAALDSNNPERQYATGALFLVQARSAPPAAAPALLAGARTAFARALKLLPRHVPSLAGLAEVSSRQGDAVESRRLLIRLQQLEPWRGSVATASAALAAAAGRDLDAAEQRLANEGDAAIAPLFAQAQAWRVAGRNRNAAQLLDLLVQSAPEQGDLQREFALALKDLDDDSGYRRAFRRSQLCFALDALEAGEAKAARGNLEIARRYLPEGASASLEELLQACSELQSGDFTAAKQRLESLDPAAVQTSLASAGPRLLAQLRLLHAAPTLAPAAERLQLPR